MKEIVAEVGPAGFGALRSEVASYRGADGEGILHVCAFNGHLEAVRSLITTFGLSPSEQDDAGATVLHYAFSGGRASVPRVLGLIRLGADPSVLDEEGSSLLHHACQGGHLVLLRYLVEQSGLDVGHRNDDGLSALDLAAGEGHLAAVQFLIEERGADPRARGAEGHCPLHWAVVAGQTKVVTYLVQRAGVQVDLPVGEGGPTPFLLAASSDHPGMCQLLLGLGADRQAADEVGDTALHRAIRMGKAEAVRFLLGERLFDIELRNKAGATPLVYAARCGDLECVRMVLAFHPAANAKDDHAHWTALHFAAFDGREEIVRALLRPRASGAVRKADAIDPNAIDLEGARPVHYAAMRGHLSVFRLLVERGAYYSVSDRNGSSALHWASSAGQLEVVQFLVEKAMDVNQQDKLRRSPLFYSCKNGHVDVVRFLLTHGAERSLQVRDAEGLMVLDAARDQPDIVAVVKAYLTARQREGQLSLQPSEIAIDAGGLPLRLSAVLSSLENLPSNDRESNVNRSAGNGGKGASVLAHMLADKGVGGSSFRRLPFSASNSPPPIEESPARDPASSSAPTLPVTGRRDADRGRSIEDLELEPMTVRGLPRVATSARQSRGSDGASMALALHISS